MSAFRFTPSAKEHLTAIYLYSASRFGDRRATTYMDAIDASVKRAAVGEMTLRPREHLGSGLLSMLSGAHVIYVRWQDGVLVVIGVLHQMMDPSRHLDLAQD
jgi:toxin ParE1/3/4